MSADIVRFEGPRELVEIALKAPALFLPEPRASQRFWEFFTANISNRNTRRAYYKAACRFSQWCEARGLTHLESVQPIHIAAFIEELELSKPTAVCRTGPRSCVKSSNTLGRTVRWAPACSPSAARPASRGCVCGRDSDCLSTVTCSTTSGRP
jgi:hypothetical protein